MSGKSALWASYVIPPIFVAVIAATKASVGDGLAFNSKALWAFVLANVAGFEIAKVVTEEGLDRMLSNDIAIEGANHFVEPVIQGLVNASVAAFSIDTPKIDRANYRGDRNRVFVEPVIKESFTGRFFDGVIINVLANWMASPITDAL